VPGRGSTPLHPPHPCRGYLYRGEGGGKSRGKMGVGEGRERKREREREGGERKKNRGQIAVSAAASPWFGAIVRGRRRMSLEGPEAICRMALEDRRAVLSAAALSPFDSFPLLSSTCGAVREDGSSNSFDERHRDASASASAARFYSTPQFRLNKASCASADIFPSA
jgi:hypothetical protein